MTELAFKESTKPLLRPNQVEDLVEEKRRLEGMLDPHNPFSKGINIASTKKQLHNTNRMLAEQSPMPYENVDLDNARKRSEELLENIKQGMPTSREMRRLVPGSVDKHRGWMQRAKDKVLEWKNIQLRLHASNVDLGLLSDSGDIANLERHRPQGGANELPMANAVVPDKQFFNLGNVGTVVFSDQELRQIKELFPDVYTKVAILDNDQREQLKQMLSTEASIEAEKPRRGRPPVIKES